MAETIKTDDFIELDYTGVLKDTKVVFDTTIGAVAKKEGLFDPKMTYGPISICVGQGQILPGLDKKITGIEVGKEVEVSLAPEEAFGKKDGRLMKLVPTSAFRKGGLNPMVGLQVNIDGAVGTVRTVTGGRTIVDFNHPFAGKEVIYQVKINRKITEDKDKVLALVELALNQKKDAITIDLTAGKATITVMNKFPDELLKLVKERILKILPSVKDVEFKVKEEKKQADKQVEKQQ